MSKVNNFSTVGIASVRYQPVESKLQSLPKKDMAPLGAVIPSYLERLFNVNCNDQQIKQELLTEISNDAILTPTYYQDLLSQLRDVAEQKFEDEDKQQACDNAFRLFDDLLHNMVNLNTQRQLQQKN